MTMSSWINLIVRSNLIGFDNGIIDLKYTSVNKSGVVHNGYI